MSMAAWKRKTECNNSFRKFLGSHKRFLGKFGENRAKYHSHLKKLPSTCTPVAVLADHTSFSWTFYKWTT